MCYACFCNMKETSYDREKLGEDYCAAFASKKAGATKWGTIAAILVVVVNQVLKRAICLVLVPYEKHHTLEEAQGSTAMKVFFCQLLNTVGTKPMHD